MIVLDATTKSMQILLAGAVTTNQLIFTSSYADYVASPAAFTPGANDGITNGATPVTLVAAPAASTQRQVKRINVYNSDTAPATVTIRVVSGANNRTQLTVTLQVGERIEYEDAEGFRVFTVAGAVKVTAVQTTVEPGYIDGLQMQWVSGTSLTVSNGTCYIPSSGANVNFPASINTAGLVLSASTWYHVYAYLNAGVPAIEIVTTAPSSPYDGTARTKSGDTTRRYIGSVRANASSQLIRFSHALDGLVNYFNAGGATLAFSRVLSNGNATVDTSVSLAAVLPVTSELALIAMSTNSTTATFQTKAESGGTIFYTVGVAASGSAIPLVTAIHPAPSQTMFYVGQAATAAAFIDVFGFKYAR